jgi:pimeloyl-ACP methyl ester carboxylesterase
MPTVRANDIDIYYEQQGSGEPLVLIPYLAIDQACYAFQVGDYAKHFTCISVDLRGAGQTSRPDGTHQTQQCPQAGPPVVHAWTSSCAIARRARRKG